MMTEIDVHAGEVRDDDVGGFADVLSLVLRCVPIIYPNSNIEPQIAKELVEFLFLISGQCLRRVYEESRRVGIIQVISRDLEGENIGFPRRCRGSDTNVITIG